MPGPKRAIALGGAVLLFVPAVLASAVEVLAQPWGHGVRGGAPWLTDQKAR